MNRYLALLKRELKSITKEKTIMFAIIVQFFIASFSSIILVGIMAGAIRVEARCGLFFVDAHGDFHTPATSPGAVCRSLPGLRL